MQPDWTNLSEKALFDYRAWADVVQTTKPAFPFRNLPTSARLEYELMDWNNYLTYLHLFAQDENPFVDVCFRMKETLDEYAVNLLQYQRYSSKSGGCDWFLKRKHTGEYVGVLNVYKLSTTSKAIDEDEEENAKTASIGYMIAEPFRRQGYAQEACLHLLDVLARVFKRTHALAVTKADNVPSNTLLQKLGFERGANGWCKKIG
jgi:RimJ/RimL family protein N-acetyltransferase